MPPSYQVLGLAVLALIIAVLAVVTIAPLFKRSSRAKLRAGLEDLADTLPPEPGQAEDDAGESPALSGTSGTGKPSRRRASPADGDRPPYLGARPRRGPAQVVATSLRLPVQFQYTMPNGSKHLRYALVVTALGHAELGGDADVTLLRCVCGASRQWRTFQIARMGNLVDLQTGEIVREPSRWIMDHVTPWTVTR